MESSLPVHVARYSLAIPIIEDGIEHETVNISVVTSSKPYEFSCADCDYVVAPYFYSSSESVEFFTMVHQVTPNVFSFSECLEFCLELLLIYVSPSDVIPLAVFDVHPLKKPIYLFLSLGVILSESDALHLPVTHDEIPR